GMGSRCGSTRSGAARGRSRSPCRHVSPRGAQSSQAVPSLRLVALAVLSAALVFPGGSGQARSLAAGTVIAWGCQGDNADFGQCSVPSGLSGVTAIAAGLTSSLALKDDGTVVAWGCGGANDRGQCSVPAGLSGVTAIAAGASHSLALKSDGTVV